MNKRIYKIKVNTKDWMNFDPGLYFIADDLIRRFDKNEIQSCDDIVFDVIIDEYYSTSAINDALKYSIFQICNDYVCSIGKYPLKPIDFFKRCIASLFEDKSTKPGQIKMKLLISQGLNNKPISTDIYLDSLDFENGKKQMKLIKSGQYCLYNPNITKECYLTKVYPKLCLELLKRGVEDDEHFYSNVNWYIDY